MSRSVVLLLLAGTAAYAQRTDKELEAGIDAFRLGKYDEARAHLVAASTHDLKAAAPHRYLAAVARAQRKWDDCLDEARRALVLEPGSSEVRDTRALHESCRVSAGRAPAGELGDSAAIAVTASVPGATVRVGGLVYGGTPIAPRPITVGRLAVQIDKPGYKHAEVAVDTVAGIVTDVIVDLEVGAETAEATPGPRRGTLLVRLPDTREAELVVDGNLTPIPGDGRVVLPPGVRLVELRERGRDPWRRRVVVNADRETAIVPEFADSAPRERRHTLGLVAGGGGIALVALGIGAFYVSRNATNEANDIARVEINRAPGDTTPPIRTRADFDAAVAKANRWGTISNVAYVAGFAAAGFGLYLYLTNRPPPDDAPAFALSPTRGGGVVSGMFAW